MAIISTRTIPDATTLRLSTSAPATTPPPRNANPFTWINTRRSRHAPNENPVSEVSRSPRAAVACAIGDSKAGGVARQAHKMAAAPMPASAAHGTTRYAEGGPRPFVHGKASHTATAPQAVNV